MADWRAQGVSGVSFSDRHAVCFDFINAKLRGMHSRLFEGGRLLSLCDVRHLGDLARRLYPDRAVPDSAALEREFLRDHLAGLEVVRKYLRGRVHDLFAWLMRRYQVENLKIVFRCFAGGQRLGRPDPYLTPTPPWLALPADEMMAARDLRAFIAQIPVRDIRVQSERLRKGAAEPPGDFFVEMGFDRGYFLRLVALQARLGPGFRDGILRMIRFDLDCHNLMSVLRARLNYGIGFDEMRPFLPLVRTGLSKRQLASMAAAQDFSAAMDRVPPSLLPPHARAAVGDLHGLQTALLMRQYRLANRCYYGATLDSAAVVAYYYLKRVELANLTRMAESLRYGMAREEIEQRLLLIRSATSET